MFDWKPESTEKQTTIEESHQMPPIPPIMPTIDLINDEIIIGDMFGQMEQKNSEF